MGTAQHQHRVQVPILGLQTKPKETVCEGPPFLSCLVRHAPCLVLSSCCCLRAGLCCVLRVESLGLARRNSHVSICSSAQAPRVARENWKNPQGYLSIPA